MADDNVPRFGQRSENWTPDGSGTTPGGANAASGAGARPEQASSWPQYGELDNSAQSPKPAWGQYGGSSQASGGLGQQSNSAANSQNAWPQYGGTQQNAGQAGGVPGGVPQNGPQPGGQNGMNPGANSFQPGNAYQPGAAGGPAGPGGPAMPGGGGFAQPAGASGPYGGAPKLPSRTVSILLIVVGAVMTLVLSVVVFFVMLISGLNVGELVETASTVSNGSTVTVDDSGSLVVMEEDGDPLSCTLTDNSGVETQMESPQGSAELLYATDLTPGDYVLDCGDQAKTLNVIVGVGPDELMDSTMKAFVWGTVIGVVGVAVFIVGVVKLVKTNRKRREIQQAAWQQRY